jgi:hypothetical protein
LHPNCYLQIIWDKLLVNTEDLDAHRSGKFKFTEIKPSERQIQLKGGFTVVSVLMHIVGSYEGTPVEQDIRFTRVWAISTSGSIQIIAGHTSAIPPQQA